MKALIAVMVWVLAAVGASAQGLDAAMPGILKDAGVASVSLAEIVDGKVVLAKAYGEQSAGVPATEATLYNIASMTKPVTAEVVLRLVSAGKVGLDEPMYKYWVDPDLAKDERAKVLTPRMALSHQMGFANWRRMTGGVLAFQHEPGTYGYSGEGYQYVARFVEKKTGRRFEDLAQEMVFGPAGMKETTYTGRPWFAGRWRCRWMGRARR
jgi:CubicO group peptidase (beta-lactamase class C family)